MPISDTLREHRLRMTKAQLIDEIDALEQRAAAIEVANKSDITERKRAEQVLAEKDAQLRAALDSVRGLLVYAD